MDRPGGAGTEGLRRDNTAAVLRSLRRRGPSTRAELAKDTGLAKATVGVIVADLQAAAAVAEEGSRPGVRGRPGRPVALRGEDVVALGLELNVDYTSAVVLDLAGQVVLSESRPGTGDTADVLALAREAYAAAVGDDRRLVGATVAVPALVRGDNRTVAWAPNLHLDGAGLADDLAATLTDLGAGPAPVVRVSNDANCAAYAESHHGAARGAAHALYLTGTVGIGAGIVQDGELVRGGAGFAGEVGHMPLGDASALCGCGRHGCWEASVGLHAMLAEVQMLELDTPLRTAEAVAERAATDPARARRARARRARRRPRDRDAQQRARPGGGRARWLLRAARRPGARPGEAHARRAPGLRGAGAPGAAAQHARHPRGRPRCRRAVAGTRLHR